MRTSAPLVLACLALAACKGKEEDEDDDGDAPACSQELRVDAGVASSGDTIATYSFDVPAGTRSFLVTATGEDGVIYVSSLAGPDGGSPVNLSRYYLGPEFLSAGVMPYFEVASFNWPVRDVDPELIDGTWTVGISALSSSYVPLSGVDFDVTVQLNRDSQLDSGCFTVRVVMTPGVAGDPELAAAVEGAVQAWSDLLVPYGITMQASFETGEALSERLDQPSLGSGAYRDLRADGDEADLVVVVGETVANSNVILGEAGGIPGSLVPNEHGVVAVGWLLHAGTDGTFDSTDVQGLGETMAHEIGHYMGLFHPIEVDGYGNPSGYTDALDDTPACSSSSECLSVLGTNLMFPFRTCYSPGCERQDDLTAQQVGVLQRYTGMR